MVKVQIHIQMLFIFSTPIIIKHLQQLKTAVFLHWWLIHAIPLQFCYMSVAFLNLVFNVKGISIQLFADAGNSNITRLLVLMIMVCLKIILGWEREIGRRK